MKKQMTSEEKLLQLIRKKKSPPQRMENDSRQKRVENSYTPKKIKEKPGQRVVIGALSFFNKILMVLALGLFVYIVLKMFWLQERQGFSFKPTVPKSQSMVENIRPPLMGRDVPSFDVYQAAFLQKDVFHVAWEKSNPKKKDTTGPTESGINNLKVVGITISEKSIVAIEDLKAKRTLFMSEGDEVNGAILKSIFEDRVEFSYKGESVELYP